MAGMKKERKKKRSRGEGGGAWGGEGAESSKAYWGKENIYRSTSWLCWKGIRTFVGNMTVFWTRNASARWWCGLKEKGGGRGGGFGTEQTPGEREKRWRPKTVVRFKTFPHPTFINIITPNLPDPLWHFCHPFHVRWKWTAITGINMCVHTRGTMCTEWTVLNGEGVMVRLPHVRQLCHWTWQWWTVKHLT